MGKREGATPRARDARTTTTRTQQRRRHTHRLREDRLIVLNPVGLINDDVVPLVLEEAGLLANEHLVRRDDDVEVAAIEALGAEALPLRLVAMEAQRSDDGAPDAELAHPVVEH